MEQLEAFDRAMREFDGRVHRIGGEQWQAATPCTEWTVRDLVTHLTAEHLWAPWLLRGATLEDVGDRFDGDVLGDDPVGSWERASDASRAAFHAPGALGGTVHTGGGPSPAEEYARQMTMDLAVHAWDLARGIGADGRLDEELAGLVLRQVEPVAAAWRGTGIFGPAVPVPASSPAQDRLLGLLGRHPA